MICQTIPLSDSHLEDTMIVKHLYLLGALASLACASAADPSQKPTAMRRNDLLTAEEIAAARADVRTAYDAVSRLRPNWLASHGAYGYASVFVDGQMQGDGSIASLRSVPAYYVASIHYYDITQSTAKFGTRGGSAGAIEVIMKKP
jgi:hypothetical protein